MPTICYSPVLGKTVRVSRLDSCCRVAPPGTDCGFVVTDGFIRVSLSTETTEGTEIAPTKANGTNCYSVRTPDSFSRMTVEIEFCQVDPDLFEMMSNAEPFVDYNGDTTGFTVGEGTLEKKFSLEMWSGLASNEEACTTPGAEEGSGYFLLPCLQGGILGDFELVGDGESNFTITGAFTNKAIGWGVGPYDVMLDADDLPAPLPAPGIPTNQHFLTTTTGVAPPPSACGCQVMPGDPIPS
jgi:hypothetical protein